MTRLALFLTPDRRFALFAGVVLLASIFCMGAAYEFAWRAVQ